MVRITLDSVDCERLTFGGPHSRDFSLHDHHRIIAKILDFNA